MTIKTVVIEDEAVTARNLIRLLGEINEDIHVVKSLSSITESVDWLNNRDADYDLIFMDIRLADGLSFEIFKQIEITKPVIFVTAYHDYAITAFKNNGLDYILKPFDEEEVKRALQKYINWIGADKPKINMPSSGLLEQLGVLSKSYKKSFLVHYRNKLLPVETAKISWFYTANEIVYANLIDGKQYVIEFTMEQLEQQLDPSLFFRANRQFIVNKSAITEVDFYFNGRLSIQVIPQATETILVSKARVPQFKSWMNS